MHVPPVVVDVARVQLELLRSMDELRATTESRAENAVLRSSYEMAAIRDSLVSGLTDAAKALEQHEYKVLEALEGVRGQALASSTLTEVVRGTLECEVRPMLHATIALLLLLLAWLACRTRRTERVIVDATPCEPTADAPLALAKA